MLALARSELVAASKEATYHALSGSATASSTVNVSAGRFAATVIQTLLDTWYDETKYMSSVQQMTGLASYRSLVRLGKITVPFLLRELQKRPGDWFLALAEITNSDPVPAAARGNFGEVRDAWLRWGIQNGYL